MKLMISGKLRTQIAVMAFISIVTLLLAAPYATLKSGRTSARTSAAPASNTTLSSPKVDPMLFKAFSLSASGAAPAIITYKTRPSPTDLSRLKMIGITKGITLRALPMVIAPINAAQLAALRTQPSVQSVWANRIMKTFTHESRPFIGVPQLLSDTEVTRANPTSPGMPVSGKGVGIGYVDTGVDATHNDLPYGTKVVQNVIQPVSELNVGDGGLAVGIGINPFDTLYEQAGFYAPIYLENQMHSDIESGHGTFGAAVAAGTGAQSGAFYGGVAPGANLIAVNSGNELGLPGVAILGAFDYMLVNQLRYNIRVVNNSWGTTLASSPDAVDPNDPVNVATRSLHDNNIVVVFAAGNGIDGVGDVPGAINPYSTMPWTISVAAGDKRGLGTPTDFSSRGENNGTGSDTGGQPADPALGPNLRPDITAPGIDIKSARMKGAGLTNTAGLLPIFVGSNDLSTIPPSFLPFYTTGAGTSFACPHVSGVVALMLEANRLLTPDDVVTILRQTANPMPYDERVVGAGYVDAHNAVRRAMGFAAVPHPFNLFPQAGGPQIVDPEGDQMFGTGLNVGGATDAQDIVSGEYRYDAAARQIIYTLTLKNAATRTQGMSWLMSSNFGPINVYVTATASDVGTMSYTYGVIDNSAAVPQQNDLGDADSGEVVGNKIIWRLSVDKLAVSGAVGHDVVGETSTGTQARAQVGMLLLLAADIADGGEFKVQ